MQNVKYLAAVSGGPDSMALLDIYRKHIKMVCHVNYHHRPTANRDAKIVKQYCKQYKIPCSILNVTVSIYKKYRKLSHNFQTMARLIRYDLFKLVSKKTKITTILIAHNQDDFLETALMQKRKGSDSLFYGIDHRSTFDSLNVYRPLLNKRKACLQAYCDKHNLTYGIDETNNDLKYERNRIRSEINQWNNTKYQSVLKSINQYNKKHALLRKQIEKQYNDWSKVNYSVKLFNQYKNKPHVLYKFLIDHDIPNINGNKINQAIDFINHGNGKLRVTNTLAIVKVNKQVKVVSL